MFHLFGNVNEIGSYSYLLAKNVDMKSNILPFGIFNNGVNGISADVLELKKIGISNYLFEQYEIKNVFTEYRISESNYDNYKILLFLHKKLVIYKNHYLIFDTVISDYINSMIENKNNLSGEEKYYLNEILKYKFEIINSIKELENVDISLFEKSVNENVNFIKSNLIEHDLNKLASSLEKLNEFDHTDIDNVIDLDPREKKHIKSKVWDINDINFKYKEIICNKEIEKTIIRRGVINLVKCLK